MLPVLRFLGLYLILGFYDCCAGCVVLVCFASLLCWDRFVLLCVDTFVGFTVGWLVGGLCL